MIVTMPAKHDKFELPPVIASVELARIPVRDLLP